MPYGLLRVLYSHNLALASLYYSEEKMVMVLNYSHFFIYTIL